MVLGLCHRLPERYSSNVAKHGYEAPQRGVRALVKQDGEHGLEEQHHDTQYQAALDRGPLQERERVLNGQVEAGDYSGENRYNRGLDNERNEDGVALRWLQASWVAQRPRDKVPEEFAVEKCEETAPDRIGAARNCHQTSVLVPNQVSHSTVVVYGVEELLRELSTARRGMKSSVNESKDASRLYGEVAR